MSSTDLVLTRSDGRSTRWPLAGSHRALAATAGLPFGALRDISPFRARDGTLWNESFGATRPLRAGRPRSTSR